ncbi:unnamed protein product [Moneuplotes crassus]|uniref:Uncharacterized protein n=1 Tax=Euplotes crassus TaxID=5936 RepID=A0AAD1YAM3_EUPCR|nr:unnamed protein product [Moneuplotes crassus]
MGGCCCKRSVLITKNNDHPLYNKMCENLKERKVKKLMQDAVMTAYEYLQPNGKSDKSLTSKIMRMNPSRAILCVLDKIFDYLNIEEVTLVSTGCKLFLYVATMDSIMDKYHDIPFALSSKKIMHVVEDTMAENINTRKESEDVEVLERGVAPFLNNNRLRLVKDEAQEEEAQSEKVAGNRKDKTPGPSPSVRKEESKRGSRSTHSYSSPWTTNSKNIHRYEKSPNITAKGLIKRQKSIMQQMIYMKNVMEAQQRENKDSFMKTVVFSDGMGEVYSDSDHLNKVLKSLSSEENCTVADMGSTNSFGNRKSSFAVPLEKRETRKPSKAVPLDAWVVSKLVADGQSSFRRLTKNSFTGREMITVPEISHNRPSMFHPYKLGCIEESLNESNDRKNTFSSESKDKKSESDFSDDSSMRSDNSVKVTFQMSSKKGQIS